MDTRTGEIVEQENIPADQREYFVPVKRELTAKEKLAERNSNFAASANDRRSTRKL